MATCTTCGVVTPTGHDRCTMCCSLELRLPGYLDRGGPPALAFVLDTIDNRRVRDTVPAPAHEGPDQDRAALLAEAKRLQDPSLIGAQLGDGRVQRFARAVEEFCRTVKS